MTKQERLHKAKELAKSFLYLEPTSNEQIPFLIQHPFFETTHLMDKNGFFDLFQEKERYIQYLEDFYTTVILSRKTIENMLSIVRKNYRLTFLYYLDKEGIYTKKQCGNLLLSQWILIENICQDVNVKKRSILTWLKHANCKKFMETPDFQVYEALPDTICVYRGVENKSSIKGFSWTLSKDTAIWFASRYKKQGSVYRATIAKEHIFLYTNDRDEKKVILNYNFLNNIEEIYNATTKYIEEMSL